MPKLRHKEVVQMLKEEILEKYFSNKHTAKIPVLFASECFTSIERVLDEIRKENPHATLSDLFADE